MLFPQDLDLTVASIEKGKARTILSIEHCISTAVGHRQRGKRA